MRGSPDTSSRCRSLTDTLTSDASNPSRCEGIGDGRSTPRDRDVGRRSEAARAAARARWSARPGLAEILARKTDRSAGPDACWPWHGRKDGDGYGRLWFDYAPHQAHKVALELALGRKLGSGEVTRHVCPGGGNRACCNPAHLEPGTVADNNRDAVKQGRQARGEKKAGRRLTTAQVEEIRRTAAPGRYEEIGRRYGVSGKTISNIARGLKWKAAPAGAVAS